MRAKLTFLAPKPLISFSEKQLSFKRKIRNEDFFRLGDHVGHFEGLVLVLLADSISFLGMIVNYETFHDMDF
jgi:hypothetical protein